MTHPGPVEPSDDPRHGMPVVPNDLWPLLAKQRPRRCWWMLPHRDAPYPGLPTYVQCGRCKAVAARNVHDTITGRPIL